MIGREQADRQMSTDERTTLRDDTAEPEESEEAVRAALVEAWTAGLEEGTDKQRWVRAVRCHRPSRSPAPVRPDASYAVGRPPRSRLMEARKTDP